MKKLNWVSTVILIGAVLSLIINLVLYSRLPDRVGMQVTFGGELNNFVPKPVFLIMTPVALIIDFIYSIYAEKGSVMKALLVGIIIFGASLFVTFLNL